MEAVVARPTRHLSPSLRFTETSEHGDHRTREDPAQETALGLFESVWEA